MSNQFYDYLSKKLIEYFQSNNLVKGERFFINFDEDSQVSEFYNSLKKLGELNGFLSEFVYKHEMGAEFKTYSLEINGVNLVIADNINVTVDYLVTLRNKVHDQDGVWENASLLIICNGAIDSIIGGMKDLQKEGMPLSINYISENLQLEIEDSKELSKVDKVTAEFSLNNQKEELFQTTLWDYENILSIIDKGHIDSEDLKGLKLFKDENLGQFTKNQMKSRLKENNELFEEIEKYSHYGDKKEQLQKKFKPKGVALLNDDNWHLTTFNEVKKNILPKSVPLNYEGSESNGLVYWERPLSETKAGERKRNIIVFNNNSLSNRVSLTFRFDQILKNEFLNARSKNIASTSGKSIHIEFDASTLEPTFKQISYKHKNLNNSYYIINIVVLNADYQVFDSIKSRYVVDVKNKRISVTNDEDSDEIVFGNGPNIITKDIEDKNGKLYLYDGDSILISETSPAWDDGVLYFDLSYCENDISFEIKEKSRKAVPVKSSTIWSLKRQNEENFVFNGIKAVQNVNSFYLEEKFKEFLKLEHQMINNDIFYGKLSIDGKIHKENVLFSDELSEAYIKILDYYKYYDDSPEDNLPSLMYLNDDLKELYENFLNIYNNEISEINENSGLSDDVYKKDLVKLGRIDTHDKIMYSSLSPINIAYQLEILKQCGDESLDLNMVERLIPNNLIPYLYSDDDTLYRPIYQDYAHEWLVYERSEDVSIGTTNVFISNVVYEKLNQFVKHFDYLFAINPNAPIKLNLINITDDKEVVKGVFNFIRSRLPDKVKTKHIIPVEINIYNELNDSSFDTLFECDSKEDIFTEFGIKIKSDSLDEMDVIHLVQDNIKYYNHFSNDKDYGYAHISFYKVKSHTNIADDTMDDISTGLSLNGLLSSVTSTTKHSGYRTGFGSKNILNYDNDLIRTSIYLNELVYNSRNSGDNIYSKNKSVVTIVKLEEENIDLLYDKSHWLTFIEPTFGIEYFDDENEVVIIHYSDQYSSSSKYDTITVTKKSKQYEEVIKDFLVGKNVKADKEDINQIIKIFNSINGEWLLRIISNDENFGREKLSIVSAIKYCLAILDHEDIVWVPISMEEILRIAGNVKLSKNKGIFASNIKSGVHSDDLLFMGLKFNDDDSIEIIFYPMEVKVGNNPNQVIKKGKNQLMNTYKLLKEQLKKIDNEDSEFKNKFFRNFFIQIFLSNNQKFIVNEIWPEKRFGRVESVKDKLLNDDYQVSYILEEYIGKGALMSFKKDCHAHTLSFEEGKQIIELPEEYAYSGLVKSIDEIYNNIQNGDTDIPIDLLLSSIEDLSSRKTHSYVYEEIEFNGAEDEFDEEILFNDDEEEYVEDELINVNVDDEVNIASGAPDPYVELSGTRIDEDGFIRGTYGENLSGTRIDEDGFIRGSYNEKVIEDEPNDITFIKDYSLDKDVSDIRALIGTQDGYTKKIYWEFGSKSIGNRHMLIQGKSGQGKTYYIQRMLKELSAQNIPSIIIDYTDGFKKSKLENEFKESLGNKLEQYVVLADKFPLNPFKRNFIEIDEDLSIPEQNSDIASRFKSTVNAVYNFGDQQLNTIYQAVIRGLEKYDDKMDLNILKQELIDDDSSSAASVLNKLAELIDRNPFRSTDFDWSVLNNSDGKVMIIQLTGLSKDIQRIISELILWDLWNYKSSNGSEDNPFVVVLDEAHNLDFGPNSPCSKILTEGRKFGWSGWFATQSVKGLMKTDEIARLENAEEKIYFHPTDDSISSIAANFSNDITAKKLWENKLAKLNKGQCIVYGSLMNSKGKVIPSDPIIVNIDPITNNPINNSSDDDSEENKDPRH